VKSTIHSWFGRSAVNSRFTWSGGRGADWSAFVVANVLPLTTPCIPLARISRATWQRGASIPSRRSRCHISRYPATPLHLVLSAWSASIRSQIAASDNDRFDGYRFLNA
jgi:hypothetical protein